MLGLLDITFEMQQTILRRYVEESPISIRRLSRELNIYTYAIKKILVSNGITICSKAALLSGSSNPMYGKKQQNPQVLASLARIHAKNATDPEAKQRLREAASGSNNPMYGKKHSTSSRQAIREAHLGKKLSEDTKLKISASYRKTFAEGEVKFKPRSGSNNPFFNKKHTDTTKAILRAKNLGRNALSERARSTSTNHLIRISEKYVATRKAVFDRDDFSCVLCSKRGGELHMDHIVPLSWLIKQHNLKSVEQAYSCQEIWDLTNLRTLCKGCHQKTDTYAGRAQAFNSHRI